jgi:hypothetical protein
VEVLKIESVPTADVVVLFFGQLDLDDLGTELRQLPDARGAGPGPAEVDDTDAGQRHLSSRRGQVLTSGQFYDTAPRDECPELKG